MAFPPPEHKKAGYGLLAVFAGVIFLYGIVRWLLAIFAGV
jgi:hypothetical protein